MECGARMFWGHLGYTLLMWMTIMAVMVTTVIITKVRMVLKAIKIKMQWWIKEEEWRGGEWSPISIVRVDLFTSGLSETKIHVRKDRMTYLIFTSLVISYLSVNLIHAIE